MTTLESVGWVCLGAFISLITVWVKEYYEDKRLRREVIMKTALENGKFSSEIVEKIARKTKEFAELYPLNDFMIYWSIMADVMTRKKITSEELRKALGKARELRRILDEDRKEAERSEETTNEGIVRK